jgi:alpha-D-ribose 1-methylphosphonate 5-triphosphate synthase subunit PhnH
MISTLSKKHNFDPVFDSQQVFRLLLEAMSNPTKVVNIKEYADKLYGGNPVFLALAMTLLDNETGFYTCGDLALQEDITALTLARNEQIGCADFIFVGDSLPDAPQSCLKSVIENAKCGALADPHLSATVIIQNEGEHDIPLTLHGPGIDGHIVVRTTHTVTEALTARDAQYYEYPQGIDLIFVAGEGDLFAIPRLTRLL